MKSDQHKRIDLGGGTAQSGTRSAAAATGSVKPRSGGASRSDKIKLALAATMLLIAGVVFYFYVAGESRPRPSASSAMPAGSSSQPSGNSSSPSDQGSGSDQSANPEAPPVQEAGHRTPPR